MEVSLPTLASDPDFRIPSALSSAVRVLESPVWRCVLSLTSSEGAFSAVLGEVKDPPRPRHLSPDEI